MIFHWALNQLGMMVVLVTKPGSMLMYWSCFEKLRSRTV
jgi:hypothetical protein